MERCCRSLFLLGLLRPSVAPSVFESIQRETSSADGPKYSVQLMTGALPSKTTEGRSSVVMTKKGGKRYRCYLPLDPNATSKDPAGSVAPAAIPSVASFLESLKGSCFYRMEGWWTYEYCFMKSVRQFHQEKTKKNDKEESTAITQDYSLGTYWLPPPAAASAADGEAGGASKDGAGGSELGEFRGEVREDAKSKSKYWAQMHGNGTHCDLTQKPRESEVRFVCASEPSHLAAIEEVSTCSYAVTFRSDLLCSHPELGREKKEDSVESVQCEPLDSAGAPLPPPRPAPGAKATASTAAAERSAAAMAAAEAAAGGNAVEPPTPPSDEPLPTARAYDLGQCMLHRKYNYRGVIIGYDSSCKQSEEWMRSMHVDSLTHGRNQPFYHVLPDTRDRPGAQVTYVAQENVLVDTPSEALFHPLIDEMFTRFDAESGRFEPSDSLLAEAEAQ